MIHFTKMHGTGNDYIYVNSIKNPVKNPSKLAKPMCDRHFGVGADGLILICPSKKADAKMRIFNADGSEAEMCGNGIRCVAKYVYERKLAKRGGPVVMGAKNRYPASLKIETKAGIMTIGLLLRNKTVESACVNMGEPRFRPRDIPVKLPGERVIERPINVLGQRLPVTCVSMGNPHAVFFCDEVEGVELDRLGPAIENSEIFPRRTNVHFVEVEQIRQAHCETKTRFRMRTWERGSGITLACGTGACACAVAAALTGRCSRSSTAQLPGGELQLNWSTEDNCVYMTGPAIEVFEGEWL
jgi:diaminopimelate epimerase